MRLTKILLALACAELLTVAAVGQKLDPDPDRIFVTPLKWERIPGASRSVKERVADGTLAILYLEGAYAEVRASFTKMNKTLPIGLNLNEGFTIRFGSWSRTDDDQLIRIESREVRREKQVRLMSCKTVGGKQTCVPDQEKPLPGPVNYHTCRLERPSSVHIADTIVCSGGLTVAHPQDRIGLADFPDIVRRLAAEQSEKKFRQ